MAIPRATTLSGKFRSSHDRSLAPLPRVELGWEIADRVVEHCERLSNMIGAVDSIMLITIKRSSD